jgi:hypothetical protein
LINIKLAGHSIPEKLPKHLIPPSKIGNNNDEMTNNMTNYTNNNGDTNSDKQMYPRLDE